MDTPLQRRRHRYTMNASKAGKYGTVNSGGGGSRSRKVTAPPVPAAEAPVASADAGECIVCADGAGKGVRCNERNHFCCFECLSNVVISWSDSYPLRIATGVRCPDGGFGSSGCGGVYPAEALRLGLTAEAAAHVTAAHVLDAQLPMKRNAYSTATEANVTMAVELWDGGLRDAALARLQRHLCDDILISRCPKCLLQYAGVRPGDCMALECKLDGAPAGTALKACGVYMCGWCDHMENTSAEIHAHVHDCPHKVGTQSYYSDANSRGYTNYEESLRRRRAVRLLELKDTIGVEAYEALRVAAQPVLALHSL